jgi:5'-methylthioadenosine phosphorylase
LEKTKLAIIGGSGFERPFRNTKQLRFKTPYGIVALSILKLNDRDVIGMTGVPEAVLARELQICYVSICYVSNMAAGLQEKISQTQASQIFKVVSQRLEQALIEAVKALPLARKACSCQSVLGEARF